MNKAKQKPNRTKIVKIFTLLLNSNDEKSTFDLSTDIGGIPKSIGNNLSRINGTKAFNEYIKVETKKGMKFYKMKPEGKELGEEAPEIIFKKCIDEILSIDDKTEKPIKNAEPKPKEKIKSSGGDDLIKLAEIIKKSVMVSIDDIILNKLENFNTDNIIEKIKPLVVECATSTINNILNDILKEKNINDRKDDFSTKHRIIFEFKNPLEIKHTSS
jgi:hypothetical protein